MTTARPTVGRLGIWTFAFDDRPRAEVSDAAAELESLGYGTIWFGEAFGRDAFTQAAFLLSATRRIVVAPGIANIHLRTAFTMAAAERSLAEAFPGRFVLGLGGQRAADQADVPGFEHLSGGSGKPIADNARVPRLDGRSHVAGRRTGGAGAARAGRARPEDA